jgi:uracil-DNA glycosylase family 4
MSNDFLKFQKDFKQALLQTFGENAAPLWGNQNAKIVSISQAPSLSVLKYGKPFFDQSGQRLRNNWYQISESDFYNPDHFYFTSVVMHFPWKDKKGKDKKPNTTFAKTWLPLELKFLKPKLFIIIGKMSADFFFPKKDFTDLIFHDQYINGVLTFVLPHPSPANFKWFIDHKEFESERVLRIRKEIHRVLFKKI